MTAPRPRSARGLGVLLLKAGPTLALLALAALIPDWRLFFVGGALGWLLAAQFLGRGRAGIRYRGAIRHLRRGDLEGAIAAMDQLVCAEPQDAGHVGFRADLHRLAGNSNWAERDFEQLVRLAPESADGCIGLAEIWAQRGDYDRARDCALQAAARDPRGWRPAYTLALIADRQGDAPAAIAHGRAALDGHIPDGRLRVLACLWLARGHARLGQRDEVRAALARLRGEKRAFADWEAVLDSAQARPIRALLGDDVQLARALNQGAVTVESLAESLSERR